MDRMTLVERLRNPAWKSDGSLDEPRTLADMAEAAGELEQLHSAKADGESTTEGK